ncbi:MAG: homocitrate synthase [Chloroflexi bacterium]|nr:homocitrate synthase [Chloroflexota bacterium]
MARVHFIDVTNRDGVQTAGISLAKLQKTMVNYYLGQLGVYQSELGFPCIWHEGNYIEANLELARRGVMGSLVLEGWCRATVEDVEKAVSTTSLQHLNLSVPTSAQMIRGKFAGRVDAKMVITNMVSAVRRAKDAGILTVGVNAEDASRTELGYLIEFAQAAKDAGAQRLRYCDTIGIESPMHICNRIKALAEVGIPIEMHCHNDLGMAVGNTIAGAKAALEAGVDVYVNATVNGLGERAGQADLLSCILALEFAHELGGEVELGDRIDLTVARRLAHYVARAFGLPLPMNQPGVGASVFAHESGIHADGVLKDRRNYELFDYDLLGPAKLCSAPDGRVITTGEYGGLAGLRHVYEQMGIVFEDTVQARQILELVQAANVHTQMPLTDDELILIARYPDQVRKLLSFPLLEPVVGGREATIEFAGAARNG